MRAGLESHEAQLATLREAEEQQARRRADEERKYLEDQARRRAQEDELRRRAENRFRAVEEEIEKVRARQQARLHAETEAQRIAEEAERRRIEGEMRRQAELRARVKAEEEARLRAQIESELRAEAAARRREEEEARRVAEAQARQRAEEEAQRLATEQARRRAEEEAQRRAEAEARRQEEEAARLQAQEEARRQAEIQARLHAEETERERQDAEKRERADLEARIRAEIEEKLRAEDEARRRDDGSRRREQILFEEAANAQGTTAALDHLDHKANGGTSEAHDSEVREIAPWFESEVESPKELESNHQSIFQEPYGSQPDNNESEFRAVSVPDEPQSFEMTSNLQQALRSNSASARASAVAELPRVGGENAYHRITAAFDDPAPEVRSSAARALFDLQDDRAATFTRALREAEPGRRRAIGNAISSSGLANEAISNLTGESRDKTYDAFSLLFLMSKAGEVRPLMRAIEEHPNTEVRLAVIKLLALSGQPEVLAAFRRMAVRGSLPAEVRSAVMEAIYQITSQSSDETN
jgi:hypothetical protein